MTTTNADAYWDGTIVFMSARSKRERAEIRRHRFEDFLAVPGSLLRRYYKQAAKEERVRDLKRLGATVVGLALFIGLVFLVGYCQNRLK